MILSWLLLVAACEPSPDDSADTALQGDRLVEGGVVVCGDPAGRAQLGPFYELQTGDWQDQVVAEVEQYKTPGRGSALGDVDDDGDIDIYLPSPVEDRLYLNDGWGTFTLGQVGLMPGFKEPNGALLVDLDDDGRLDLLVLGGGESRVAMQGDDGTFGLGERLDSGMPETASVFGASLADVDGDGQLDLFLPVFGMQTIGPEGALDDGAPSRLLLGKEGGVWEDATAALPAAENIGYSFIGGFTDHDGDGDPDLLVTYDHGPEVMSNRLWRNEGGRFEDVSEATGLDLAISAMGLGMGDLNGDGLPDYLISDTRAIHLLESSPGPTWVRTAASRGLTLGEGQEVGWGAEIADMDNDGVQDLVMVFGYWDREEGNREDQPDALYRLEGGLYVDVAASWGVDDEDTGRGLALGDLNGDGWLDMVKRPFGEPARVHLSRCDDQAWLRVSLEQEAPNIAGIGALIEVEAGGQVQRRQILSGGTGLASGGPAEAHFGLGTQETIERLRVSWPDGGTSEFEGVDPRQRVHIERAPRASER